MRGRSPTLKLALHRSAWHACKQLLAAAGIDIPVLTSLQYSWRASLHSLTWQTQPKPEPAPSLPVAAFVCGYWRSGTTLLHEILAKDARWRAPTTQECMNPGQPAAAAQRRESLTRPMDNLTISADSPQEDEFALLALGAPSLYRVLLCPKAWVRQARELEAGSDLRIWQQRHRVMLQLFAFLQAVDGRELLLKSPTHSFSLPLLLQSAPTAKAIVIVRNWQDVWPSCWRMWQAMFGLYAIGPWDDRDIEGLVSTAYEIYARAVHDLTKSSCVNRIAAIAYQDLIASPGDVLRRLYSRFGWPLTDDMVLAAQLFVEATKPAPHTRGATAPPLSSAMSGVMHAAHDTIYGSLNSMRLYV